MLSVRLIRDAYTLFITFAIAPIFCFASKCKQRKKEEFKIRLLSHQTTAHYEIAPENFAHP